MRTGEDIQTRALLLLNYTDQDGKIRSDLYADIFARSLTLVNQIYADIWYSRFPRGFTPLQTLSEPLLLPDAAADDVMPYGVAMLMAQSVGDADNQALFAQLYNAKRGRLSRWEPRKKAGESARHVLNCEEAFAGVLPVEHGGTGNASVDTVPTDSSAKMVTSGGLFGALQQILAASVNLLNIGGVPVDVFGFGPPEKQPFSYRKELFPSGMYCDVAGKTLYHYDAAQQAWTVRTGFDEMFLDDGQRYAQSVRGQEQLQSGLLALIRALIETGSLTYLGEMTWEEAGALAGESGMVLYLSGYAAPQAPDGWQGQGLYIRLREQRIECLAPAETNPFADMAPLVLSG